MKRNTVFFSDFKHIGPIQIITDGQSSTVISILGIRRFNFSRLPHNRNNKYTVLKLSMKTYMNSIIDGFDDIETHTHYKNGFLGFIKNLITPLTLESSNYIEKLKAQIIKNYKDFDSENVNVFMEIDCPENILDVFHVPILVYFENFKESLFFNQDTMSISDKEISSLKVVKKDLSDLNRMRVLRNFILAEIKFYQQIRNFSKDIYECNEKFNSVLSVVSYYKSIVEELCEKFLIRNDSEFLDKLGNNESDAQIWNENSISSKEIADIYLSRHNTVASYLDFITEYEMMSDKIDENIREKITTILSKATNYSKLFTQLCEVDDCSEIRRASLVFYRFNRFLNLHSEKIHLKQIEKHLEKSHILSNEELTAVLDCNLSENNNRIYLTHKSIFISDQNDRLIFSSKLKDTDILLYNKIIYVITKSTEILKMPFFNIKNTKNILVRLESVNKETTKEFCDKVYATKYNCRSSDGFFYFYKFQEYCQIPGNEITEQEKENLLSKLESVESSENPRISLFENTNQILVSKIDGYTDKCDDCADPRFAVKIEDMYFRTGGIIQLNQKEMLERIKARVELKKMEALNSPSTLSAIISIISNIDQRRIKQFCLDIYPEDEISFVKKKDIFQKLYQIVLSVDICENKPVKSYFPQTFVDFAKHLYPGDVLERYNENMRDYYIRRYLNTMYSGCNQTKNGFSNLEEAVVVFSMVIQRNLYYFFDVNDLEKLDNSFLISEYAKNMKPYTVENFRKLSDVIIHLQKAKRDDLIDLITTALFQKKV